MLTNNIEYLNPYIPVIQYHWGLSTALHTLRFLLHYNILHLSQGFSVHIGPTSYRNVLDMDVEKAISTSKHERHATDFKVH
jgi:hypothetical protein